VVPSRDLASQSTVNCVHAEQHTPIAEAWLTYTTNIT
jgi:hypothetical protein